MAILNNSNAISSGGYDINNSLRFRSSASAYLSRTPAGAGNRQTWTWSGWIKRGSLGTDQAIFSVAGSDNATYFLVKFDTNNCIYIGNYTTNIFVTSQTFRDPSAWYHIVVVLDTTQATANNRLKLYINGSQVTAFSSNNIAANIAQNSNQGINAAAAHNIGREALGGVFLLDAYQTEINFINAQALTPSSFGETDTTTGSWKPKAYTGTYGTNGFYLKFSDIATTSGSNAGLGKDFSGNANYWTTNNISVTAGTTYDAMTDSPTLTSATVANYATLNPVLQNGWWAAPNRGTISNGNLTHVSGGSTTAFGNFDFVANSGKWYYEVTCGATDSNNTIVIAAQSRSTFEVGYYQNGQRQINGATPTSYGSSWTSGDVIGVAIDVPNNSITFYKNNVSQGAITNTFPTGQPVYGGSYYNSSSGDYNYNFGQRPFAYTPPTGYVRLNTYNLPDSTIKKGNTVMDATLWTGNGTSQTITNAASFRPDFVWIKQRSSTEQNQNFDSVRGATKVLNSNLTNAESTDATKLTAFNSNGFSIGSELAVNRSGFTYVGWQWQAGQGSTSSNTSGTITSTVSVNATAGFSIVTYTGTGSAATIGHGLGVAPKMIIAKGRGNVDNWPVYHASANASPATGHLLLNTTAAFTSTSTTWNNTAPTSTVFTVGTDTRINQNTITYVAYCWAEIAGFSKFGSYTGNGSGDGPFVFLGFRPKFIMLKSTTTAGSNWWIYDTSRSTYNAADSLLFPNLNIAEYSGGVELDILSNGFKFRNFANDGNKSGDTFIYAAFAENPFKNALAR